MPTYTMKNTTTGEVKEMVLSLSEREQLLQNGEWEQLLSTPKLVTSVHGTLRQAGSGWQEVLNKVKSGSGKNNTVNN